MRRILLLSALLLGLLVAVYAGWRIYRSMPSQIDAAAFKEAAIHQAGTPPPKPTDDCELLADADEKCALRLQPARDSIARLCSVAVSTKAEEDLERCSLAHVSYRVSLDSVSPIRSLPRPIDSISRFAARITVLALRSSLPESVSMRAHWWSLAENHRQFSPDDLVEWLLRLPKPTACQAASARDTIRVTCRIPSTGLDSMDLHFGRASFIDLSRQMSQRVPDFRQTRVLVQGRTDSLLVPFRAYAYYSQYYTVAHGGEGMTFDPPPAEARSVGAQMALRFFSSVGVTGTLTAVAKDRRR